MINPIAEHVNSVKENGYKKVENFVTSDEAKELETLSLKAFENADSNYFHTNTNFVKVLSITEDMSENIEYFQFLNQFFTDSHLLQFVSNYFNSQNIEISKIFLAESSNNGEKVNVLPYKMHFDKTRYLKFMIYLRDVFENDGGVTFAKKEWNTKLQKELLKREALKEENVVEVNELSHIDEIRGTAGTAAIFDTNITHKAGQVLGSNKRLVLRIDTREKIN